MTLISTVVGFCGKIGLQPIWIEAVFVSRKIHLQTLRLTMLELVVTRLLPELEPFSTCRKAFEKGRACYPSFPTILTIVRWSFNEGD